MPGPEFSDNLFSQREEEKLSAKNAKCPSCGANFVYDPATRSLKCPYCNTTKKLAEENYCEEQDLAKLFSSRRNEWRQETKAFRCSNCGATVVVSEKEIAKACPFCGTDNVIAEKEISGFRPDAVLPFTLPSEQAEQCIINWAKKRPFAPQKFKKSISPENVRANYTPAFTFDASTLSHYDGELGEYYYVTKTVNGKTVSERRIRYFHIHGDFRFDFDDLLVYASNEIPEKHIDRLQPFDTNSSQKYSPDYLYGFSATQYTGNGEECWKTAHSRMYNFVSQKILAQYPHDVVVRFNVDMHCKNIMYKYVLLPVYVGHFNYKQKLYNFFVNGRNGQVAGSVPRSPVKIGALVAAILGVIAAIVIVYLTSGGNL